MVEMRYCQTAILLIAVVFFSGDLLATSYREPPPFEVRSTTVDDRFIRLNARQREFEIWTASTMKILWKVKIPTFSYRGHGTQIVLSDDGTYLIHYLSDDQLHTLNSTIIEVYSERGLTNKYLAEEVVSSLRENDLEGAIAGSPRYSWRNHYNYKHIENDSSFVVRLLDDGWARFSIVKHKVHKYGPTEDGVNSDTMGQPNSSRH